MNQLQRLMISGPDISHLARCDAADFRDRWDALDMGNRAIILISEDSSQEWLEIEASDNPVVVKALADLRLVWRLAR